MTRTMATPLRVLMLSLVLMIVLFDRAETLPEFPDFETHSRIILSENRGYKDVLIAIADTVPEDGDLIDKIKEVFTEFSKFLYSATNVQPSHGIFFERVSILIPSSWSGNHSSVPRTWETFEASDVRVDNPPKHATRNPNRPFTNKATSCGVQGSFIGLTTDYITNDTYHKAPYGDRSKQLAHQWGLFRWGVFKEYPVGGDQHFYAASNGTYEATRCATSITGTKEREDGTDCYIDPMSGQPDNKCRFIDNDTQLLEASLMYKVILRGMKTFCDNEEMTRSNPSTAHNALAPNQQNIQCGCKSIWEVMRQHSDFNSSVNASTQINVAPIFRLVKWSRDPIILVLDTSGSMQYGRCHILRQVAFNLITNVLHEDQLVAVVTFNDFAQTKIGLTEVGQNRSQLVEALPKNADCIGGTTIGGGIERGIDVFNSSGSYSGAQMILLTDGEETVWPHIQNVSDSQLAGITVHTIAIGPNATQELEDVANRTGGRTYEHSDRSAALFNIFIQLAIRDVSDVISIMSEAFDIQNLTKQFTLEAIHGYTMTILVGLPAGFLSNTTVYVTKPNGSVIGTDEFENTDFELIQIDTDIVPGVWKVSVEYPSADIPNFTGTMYVEIARGKRSGGKSTTNGFEAAMPEKHLKMRRSGDERPTSEVTSIAPSALPISIAARWGLPTINSYQIQTVQVIVSQGYTPVSDAKVNVSVTRPNTTVPKVMLDLYDDGLGADVRKDDGVYTGFFTDFKGTGRYHMEVNVIGEEGVTKLLNDNRVGEGPILPDPNYPNADSEQPSGTFTGGFDRFIGGSSFKCNEEELCSGDEDIYPPYRITDLRVTLLGNMTAELTFTATGDDLDRGTASRYEIRVSKNITDLVKRFNSTQLVENTDGNLTSPPPSEQRERRKVKLPDQDSMDRINRTQLVESTEFAPLYVSSGNLTAPLPTGQQERFEVKLPDEVGEFSYIFGIVAVDDGGRRSYPSNFASVTANPPEFKTTPMKTTPIMTPTMRTTLIMIILIITILVLLCLIPILIALVYRRRKQSKDDKDTESSSHLPNYGNGNDQVENGVITPDTNANNQGINDAIDYNYPFVSLNPSAGTAVASDYADIVAGGVPVNHYALKQARKVYVAPSEIAKPILGVHNPAFDEDDLAAPPDYPPPRLLIAVQPPSELDDDSDGYENVSHAKNRHAMNLMRGEPAVLVLPPKIKRKMDNTRKAPIRPPRPAASPGKTGPSTGPKGAPGTDESDDEHGYDVPPPTRKGQQ